MLQTHERVVVAIGRGSGVYGSSAAPQQSTEVKPAKSASHLERLSDPPLSSGHGLEPVAEQLRDALHQKGLRVIDIFREMVQKWCRLGDLT